MQDGKLVLVLVDDHDLFTQGLVLLLKTRAGDRFEVGGTTNRVEEAAALVERTGADIAIVDLAMPPLDGVPAIRQIKALHAETKVVALSGTTDLRLAEDALRAGADGFLAKSADPDLLVAPLLSVAAGFRVVEDALFTTLLDAVRHPPEELLAQLTSEEIRLWVLLSRGLETTEIAERMLVSERTAKRLIASLLNKLSVPNRTAAAGMAGHYGLLGKDAVRSS